MMRYFKHTAIAFSTCILFAACKDNRSGSETENKTDTVAAAAPQPLSMTAGSESPEFKNAQLDITSVKAERKGNDSVKVIFNFNVSNYELKQQTEDAEGKQCNNSAKGQHIHFIMDNKPYVALYEPIDTTVLANNSEHYLMAFLSRSYHESLKNKGAAVLYHFRIDEKGRLKTLDNPKTPMIFYSRPKGDYIGKDTANVLLDFYVWNANLASDAYKVNAQIHSARGRDTNIIISEWKANMLHNLGMGKSIITLSLVDKDNKAMEGPNTSASRVITLAAQEPMK